MFFSSNVTHGLGVDPVTGIAYYTPPSLHLVYCGAWSLEPREPRNPNSVAITQQLVQCPHDQPEKAWNQCTLLLRLMHLALTSSSQCCGLGSWEGCIICREHTASFRVLEAGRFLSTPKHVSTVDSTYIYIIISSLSRMRWQQSIYVCIYIHIYRHWSCAGFQ